ncbi:hypothetical protein J6590_072141 [Homalodisca vitripennis]|nr:hypothetical protein J6590_072141 [Homalodisca vitripennis]
MLLKILHLVTMDFHFLISNLHFDKPIHIRPQLITKMVKRAVLVGCNGQSYRYVRFLRKVGLRGQEGGGHVRRSTTFSVKNLMGSQSLDVQSDSRHARMGGAAVT